MLTSVRSIVGACLQFAIVSVFLCLSFLAHQQFLVAFIKPMGLVSVMAAALIAVRVLVGRYRYSQSPPTPFRALLLAVFQFGLSILTLLCAIGFFFDCLKQMPPDIVQMLLQFNHPALSETAILWALTLLLSLLLELALIVLLGYVACADCTSTDPGFVSGSRNEGLFAHVERELRHARDSDRSFRKQVEIQRKHIERQLRRVVDSDPGKLAD